MSKEEQRKHYFPRLSSEQRQAAEQALKTFPGLFFIARKQLKISNATAKKIEPDVESEFGLRVYRIVKSYRKTNFRLASLLIGSIKNFIKKALTKMERRQEMQSRPIFLEKIRELIQKHPEQPFSRMVEEEQIAILNKALEELKPKYKQVLKEYYLEEKSLEEIAKRMGSTKQNVHSLLKAALPALERKILKYHY